MSTEEKKETGKSDERRAQLEEIKDMGSVTAFDGKHKIYCLTVIGEIEGHSVLPEQNKTTKYEHVIPQLVAIEESREIEGLLVVLNTVGGDVRCKPGGDHIIDLAGHTAHPRRQVVALDLNGGFVVIKHIKNHICDHITDLHFPITSYLMKVESPARGIQEPLLILRSFTL